MIILIIIIIIKLIKIGIIIRIQNLKVNNNYVNDIDIFSLIFRNTKVKLTRIVFKMFNKLNSVHSDISEYN